jgi:transcriptional regulator with XRE-family HTH domain
MSHTIELLDKYKKACSLASDNACAASLGVSRQAISKWRHGENHPDADSIEAMCSATGESVARWLPLIEADRARSPAARKVWLRLAQMAAAVTLAVGLSPAHSATSGAGFSADNSAHVYIM